jgi:hypothetical protein
MRPWLVTAIAAFMLLPYTHSYAAVYRVAQESAPGVGDFDSNVLGSIAAFSTPLSAAEYYGYGNSGGTNLPNSFNGSAPPLTANRSHWFLLDASDGLSLTVVHNAKNAGGVTSWAGMQLDLTGDPNGAQYLVLDDPEDQYLDTGPNLFTTGQGWGGPFTDGVVVGSLEGNWTMYGQFREAPAGAAPLGLDSWAAYSADGSIVSLQLDLLRRVRIDQIPEPSTLAIWCVLGIAIGSCRWNHRCRRRG